MSEQPPKHAWATFRPVPRVARAPSAPLSVAPFVAHTKAEPRRTAKPAPAATPPIAFKVRALPAAAPVAPSSLPAAPPPSTHGERVSRKKKPGQKTAKPETTAAANDWAKPSARAEGGQPTQAERFDAALAQASAERAAARRQAEEEAQRSWLWRGVRDSVREHGRRGARLAAWWRRWRTTPTAIALAAFAVIYAVQVAVRTPGEATLERSRRAEEIASLEDFLKGYCRAGGTVFTSRSRGGSELYPRGVVMEGELLDAFRRAPVGSTFTVKTSVPASNPIAGFYGYPPIYVGGSYFALERKFNLALYRGTFLLRKDSEQTGAMLVARIERAN